jgi:hypothetical protein
MDAPLPHEEVVSAELVRTVEWPPPARVPGRFDIGAILLVTAGFAVLFTLMKALRVDPGVILWLVGLVVFIGASQMVFSKRSPRWVSVVAGAIYSPLATMAASLLFGVNRANMLDELILGATCSLVMGAPLGYVVGTLVASLFLIGERLGFTVTERLRSARQSSVD